MIDEKCSLCRYWLFNIKKGAGDGWCRKYPPQIAIIPGPAGQVGIASNFPEIHGEKGWCGEFKPKLQS